VSPASEPVAAELLGNSPGQVLRRYWQAMRPAFFPASVLPVVVGTAWGHAASGSLDLGVAALALLATMLVHAGANVINDVADEKSGTDRTNVERIFPYTGGSRIIQNEILSLEAMQRFGVWLLGAACICGALLAWLKGPFVLAFGLAGVVLATLYSLRPAQLAGRGVGEAAIATAFGVLPVTGAAWLQSGIVDFASLLISIPVAMWVSAILLINEVPDVAADAAAGKRTLPVRLGIPGARRLYVGLHAVALLAIIAAVFGSLLSPFALIVPPFLFVLALSNARGVRPVAEARASLTRAIERTLAIHSVGCLWLAVWAWHGTATAGRLLPPG
jgi:1,4-dihydroxy-2-naphthoate octaprenyltransferase